MAASNNAERQRQYNAERNKQLEIAGGRLAVSRAIGYWPSSIKLTPTDSPKLFSVTSADPELAAHDYAAFFENVGDVFAFGSMAVLALIEARTRWRPDYVQMRDLLARREPTLPIALEATNLGWPDNSPSENAERITDLRIATCVSSIAKVALYQETNHLSMLDMTGISILRPPKSVAATL